MRHRPASHQVDVRVGLPPLALHGRRRLARQDRRSAALARLHGALGVLMSAERVSDVVVPACHADTPAVEASRAALDVLWRALFEGRARRTTHWNPGVRHVRQAYDLQRWALVAGPADVAALLRCSRRLAADELDTLRSGRGRTVPAAAVPSA